MHKLARTVLLHRGSSPSGSQHSQQAGIAGGTVISAHAPAYQTVDRSRNHKIVETTHVHPTGLLHSLLVALTIRSWWRPCRS